jgi:K+-sensing histidine kinase KdpD
MQMPDSPKPIRLIASIASVAVLAAIVTLAYRAGSELLIGQFFLLPVAIAAWYGGRVPAWAMAVTAWVSWIWVNAHIMPSYVHANARYWNWGIMLARLLVAGTVIAVLREALDSSRRNLAEKEAALRELSESTAKLRSYEGQYQTICAWTNQIKDGDEWISFPDFLSRHLRANVTHGISPEAAAKLKAEHKKSLSPPEGAGEARLPNPR